jgi:hypothetical protein
MVQKMVKPKAKAPSGKPEATGWFAAAWRLA